MDSEASMEEISTVCESPRPPSEVRVDAVPDSPSGVRTRPAFPWETPGPKPVRTSLFMTFSFEPPTPRTPSLPLCFTGLTSWPDSLSTIWLDVAIKPYERDSCRKIALNQKLFPTCTHDAVELVQTRFQEVEGLARGSGAMVVRKAMIRPVIWAVRWTLGTVSSSRTGSTAPRPKGILKRRPSDIYHVGDDKSFRTDVDSEKVPLRKSLRARTWSVPESVAASTLVHSVPETTPRMAASDYDALLCTLASLNVLINALRSRYDLNLNQPELRGPYSHTLEESRIAVRCLAHVFVVLGLAERVIRSGLLGHYDKTSIGTSLSSLQAILDRLPSLPPGSSPSLQIHRIQQPSSSSTGGSIDGDSEHSTLKSLKSTKVEPELRKGEASTANIEELLNVISNLLESLAMTLRAFSMAHRSSKSPTTEPTKRFEEYNVDE